MPTKYLGGKAELAIGTQVIEPEFLGDITVNYVEGTRSTTSLAGTITKPSGSYETAEITGSFLLPSMDALKKLYAHLYKAGVTDDSGRVEFGGNTCVEQEATTVNIHYTCEANSKNDFHAGSALIKADFNATYDTSGVLTVPFTIMAQPDENGVYGWAGNGDLTKENTLWDATTQTWVEVVPSAQAL